MSSGAASDRGPAPAAAAPAHHSPHQETLMHTLSYQGYCVDTIVGQVSEPADDGSRMVATLAQFDAMTNRTHVSFVPLPLGSTLTRDGAGMLRLDRAHIAEDGTLIGLEPEDD